MSFAAAGGDEESLARKEVTESQREINSIKAAILKLDAAASRSAGKDGDNVVQFVWTKLTKTTTTNGATTTTSDASLEDGQRLSLQMSSPVEEAFLYECSNSDSDDGFRTGGSAARFEGVDVPVATLTVSIQDNNNKNNGNNEVSVVGESEAHEMEGLCSLEGDDPFNPKDEYKKELIITIKQEIEQEEKEETKEEKTEETKVETKEETEAEPDKEPEKEEEEKDTTTTTEETKPSEEEETPETQEDKEEGADDDKDDEEKEKETDAAADEAEEEKEETIQKEEEEASPTTTTIEYSIALQVTYKPSAKDQKVELVRLLNKAGERRQEATKKLREAQTKKQSAPTPVPDMDAPDADADADAPPMSTTTARSSKRGSGPAVKAGFLNKSSSTKETPPKGRLSRMGTWCWNKFGPQSFLVAGVFPVAKNYAIFLGFVTFMHFKGQEFALPAPV